MTPDVLSDGTRTNTSSVYTTDSYTPPSGGVLLLAVMVGGANPVPALVPDSVTGNGTTWTLVDGGQTPNTRNAAALFVADGASRTAGAVTITLAADVNRLAYRIVHVPVAAVRQYAIEAHASLSPTTATLPDALAQDTAVFGMGVCNGGGAPIPGAGQSRLGSDLEITQPTGTLITTWADPSTEDTSFLTSGAQGRVVIAAEIEPLSQSGAGVFMVVGGAEVPVTSVTLVQQGSEVPATLEVQ